jgi:MFS family permease
MPFSNSYSLSRSAEGNRGKYMGLYTMTYSVANIVGPYFGLQIAARYGFDVLWYVSGLMCLPTIAGLLWMKRRNPEPTKPSEAELGAEVLPVAEVSS